MAENELLRRNQEVHCCPHWPTKKYFYPQLVEEKVHVECVNARYYPEQVVFCRQRPDFFPINNNTTIGAWLAK